MSGIRVSIYNTERPLAEKDLTAYFSNPDHGGGKIATIHYPVFQNDAVIIFEDEYSKCTSGLSQKCYTAIFLK